MTSKTNDTIVAIATPAGEGGISSVRISGNDAFEVADRIFRTKSGTSLKEKEGYTAAYGHIYDGDTLLDDGIALVFRAPKSYTGENIVEISSHGGNYLIRRVLRAAAEAGARIAEGGEFTKRAFENGKLSLTQAESVMQLISAKGSQALTVAARNKEGSLSKFIGEITDKLLFLVSQISVYSDFPEDETLMIEEKDFILSLEEIVSLLQKLIKNYDRGKYLVSGINTAIVGSPNAGKSTLMNLLSKTQRSIVTPIAGTTRDIIEQTVQVGEFTLCLADTAGIRNATDEVEKIGVDSALKRLKGADLCLGVFDISKPPEKEDIALIERLKDRASLLVLNKKDLTSADNGFYQNCGLPFVKISAKTGEGEENLISGIKRVLKINELDPNAEILGNERQYQKVISAEKAASEAILAIKNGVTLDAVGILIDDALSSLLELDGKKITTEVANEVFKNFCVGK